MLAVFLLLYSLVKIKLHLILPITGPGGILKVAHFELF